MQIVFILTNSLELTYNLNDSDTVRLWSAQIAEMTQDNLVFNSLNHRHGFASGGEINEKIDRLHVIAKILGIPLAGTDQESLNELHRLFVNLFRGRQRAISREEFNLVHELNLTIHWLEYEMHNMQLINVNFNHATSGRSRIHSFPRNEMTHFTTDYSFGQLHLHYIHIGRFFSEMFMADDIICPQDHFKPQHEFSATCGLVFSETKIVSGMKEYYDKRGGEKFFGYRFDDPMLAKGYFKLGQLNGYTTLEERNNLREQIKSSNVVGWKFR